MTSDLRQASVHPNDFAYHGPKPETEPGTLADLFWNNDGAVVDKWLHYLPIYERYFSRFRGSDVRFLEIGVAWGGSLNMWRRYFGDAATIYSVDVDEKCASFGGTAAEVRIGSQDDAAYLARVIEEMGGVDIVLDDGSHESRHIRASLNALYPALCEGGIYMIEDLHCAYWPQFSGGYQAPEGIVADVKQMIDDIHHWYHDQGEQTAATAGTLSGIHVYDSIVVLEKATQPRPARARVRRGEVL